MKYPFKKLTAFAVLTLVFLTAVLSVSACSGSSDGNGIIIVSEEKYNSSVKPKDGEKLKFSTKKLREFDEEKLIVGNRYYMLIHLEDKGFEGGNITVQGNVTTDKELLINSGSKNELTVEKGLLGFGLANNDEKKGIKLYAALGFTADGEGYLCLKFNYYLNNGFKEIKADKASVYPKQVTVSSSLKYLSEADYESDDLDSKLTDSITAAVGEKVYAVIDYNLSGNSEIEDTDTATLGISTSVEKGDVSLMVEELPTADYKQDGNSITATFKIGRTNESERSFRFIVSLKADRSGTVGISSSLSGEKISFLNDSGYFAASASGQFDVSQDIKLESKLAFTLSDDQTYYILTGIGKETGDKITVPSSYKGLPVKEIAAYLFSQSRYIKQVTLSDGLEKIGVGAFSGCTGLKSIIIPNTVNSIGKDAFKDCTSDIYCNISEKPSGYADGWVSDDTYVTYDFENCFEKDESGEYYIFSYNGKGSANVSVPAEYNYLPLKKIASEAFYLNTELKSVKIPDSVTWIGSDAFYYCTGLTSVTIPDSVTFISTSAFEGCTSLESITLPFVGASKDASDYRSHFGYIFGYYKSRSSSGHYSQIEYDYQYGMTTFYYNYYIPSSLKTVVITAEGSIKEYSFRNCTGLTSITIPKSVTSIGSYAFEGCTGLTTINYGGTEAEWNRISKGDNWNYNTGSCTINYNCTGE